MNDTVFVIEPGSYRLAAIRIGDDDRIHRSIDSDHVFSHDLFERYFFDRAIGIRDPDVLGHDFYFGYRPPRRAPITFLPLSTHITDIALRAFGTRWTLDLYVSGGVDFGERDCDLVRRAIRVYNIKDTIRVRDVVNDSIQQRLCRDRIDAPVIQRHDQVSFAFVHECTHRLDRCFRGRSDNALFSNVTHGAFDSLGAGGSMSPYRTNRTDGTEGAFGTPFAYISRDTLWTLKADMPLWTYIAGFTFHPIGASEPLRTHGSDRFRSEKRPLISADTCVIYANLTGDHFSTGESRHSGGVCVLPNSDGSFHMGMTGDRCLLFHTQLTRQIDGRRFPVDLSKPQGRIIIGVYSDDTMSCDGDLGKFDDASTLSFF